MLIGAFAIAFEIENWVAFVVNLVNYFFLKKIKKYIVRENNYFPGSHLDLHRGVPVRQAGPPDPARPAALGPLRPAHDGGPRRDGHTGQEKNGSFLKKNAFGAFRGKFLVTRTPPYTINKKRAHFKSAMGVQ